MNTTLKIAGVAVWFFGQSLVLPAQTAWYNPVADSLLLSLIHISEPTRP